MAYDFGDLAEPAKQSKYDFGDLAAPVKEEKKPDPRGEVGLIGKAILGVGERIHQTSKFLSGLPEKLGSAAVEAGTKLGAPPELTAGVATAAHLGTELAPGALAGGGTSKTLGTGITKLAGGAAEWSMMKAINPIWSKVKSGEAATAVRTMLREGLTVTPKGVRILQGKIDDLNAEIKDIISKSTKTIDKEAVARRLEERIKQVKKQVNPQADVATVEKTLKNFLEHPDLVEEIAPGIKVGRPEIPIQQAQELKQGTYRSLGGRAYNPAQTAEQQAQKEAVQSQKGLARGLKEEIAKAEPSVKPINAKESELLKTMSLVERRAFTEAASHPGWLAWLAHNPKSAAAFAAGRSPAFSSYLALKLQQVSKIQSQVPHALGGAVGAYTQKSLSDHEDINR
jgi:hypothetical protein